MLRCPCCGALAFEDIDICYECMHPLGEQRRLPSEGAGQNRLSDEAIPKGKHVRVASGLASTGRECDELGSLGDVYCYSIDSSLEVPEGPHGWMVEMNQPGLPGVSRSVFSSHPKVSIGRSRDNDLVITDLRVSRHHALIELSGDALWAHDLESKNMTYLDGVPLLGTRQIGDGAELRIGAARLRVSRSPSSPAVESA